MTNSLQRLSLWLCFSLSALLLAGCSTTRVVESEVSSFSTLSALPAPPTYRLERLPSQQAQAVQFATIEAQAQQALARVGLQRDDANAKLVLQLGVQGGMVPNPYWSGYPRAYPFGGSWPYGRWGWSMGYGRGWGGGMGMGMGMGGWMMDAPPPLYHRKVSLVLRDAATQTIVYETSAVHEDIWTNDPAIFGVLFDAALSGFPQPPKGPRVVKHTMDLSSAAAEGSPQVAPETQNAPLKVNPK